MKKQQIRLPRREFLKLGGAGVLGTFIFAATLNRPGAQAAAAENVMANLKALRMGDFNPNYATQWSYRLAQALGYFKEVGIDDLEVTVSDEYMPGLIGGSLDLTHGDTSSFLSAGDKSGLPVKMGDETIGAIATSGGSGGDGDTVISQAGLDALK